MRLNSHPSGLHFLQIPGPSNVPDRILRAIDHPTIDHRGPEFNALAKKVLRSIRQASHRTVIYGTCGSVREALRFQSGYFGVTDNDDWIDELLESLGLADKAHHNMRQLSGGMKRRVLVAQALVHRPPVIILDEPTAGVDVELRQSLWQFISRLNQDGHTIVLTTHYLEEAEALCQRIAMLKQGKIVALDTTTNLLTRYGSIKKDGEGKADLEDVFVNIMSGGAL